MIFFFFFFLTWKNPWKKAKFLNFPGYLGIFAISFILICKDWSVSILVSTHEPVRFKYSAVLIIYLSMFIRSDQKVKVIFILKSFLICCTWRLELPMWWSLLSLFGVFYHFFMLSQTISWITHVTTLKSIGDARTAGIQLCDFMFRMLCKWQMLLI